MGGVAKLVVTGALVPGLGVPAAAQQTRAGDKDDQLVITGCVMRSGKDNSTGARSLLVWSRGNIYLDPSCAL